MRNRYLRVAVALVFLVPFLTVSFTVEAQTVAGTLQGTVTDTSGAPLPGATVTVRNRDTGQERRVVTNSGAPTPRRSSRSGPTASPPSLGGFGTVVRERVEVSLNSTAIASFSLTQRVAADVVVVAESSQINTVNAEIKGSLTAEQIQDKPSLNQGSFLALAETFTGFQENPTSGQNNPTLSSGSSVNFNGTGTRGSDVPDQRRQQRRLVREPEPAGRSRSRRSRSSRSSRNSYSAEFGRGYGAVVLVQTKSGTNTVDGESLRLLPERRVEREELLRGDARRSRTTTGTSTGYVVGFPILQDTLFGFVSVDRIDYAGQQNYARDLSPRRSWRLRA